MWLENKNFRSIRLCVVTKFGIFILELASKIVSDWTFRVHTNYGTVVELIGDAFNERSIVVFHSRDQSPCFLVQDWILMIWDRDSFQGSGLGFAFQVEFVSFACFSSIWGFRMVKGIQRDSKGMDRITFDGLLGHLVAVPPNSILSAPPPINRRHQTWTNALKTPKTVDFGRFWRNHQSWHPLKT